MKKHKKNLKDKLEEIYCMEDLKTECCRKLECCTVACPQMSYSEFVTIITDVWNEESEDVKIDLICNCIKYWFKTQFEKWGIETLVKPCLFLDKEGKLRKYIAVTE